MRKRLRLVRERIAQEGVVRVFETLNATANVMDRTIRMWSRSGGEVPADYESTARRLRRVSNALRYVITQRNVRERKLRVV